MISLILQTVSDRSESLTVFGHDYVINDTTKEKTELGWRLAVGEFRVIAWVYEKELVKIS